MANYILCYHTGSGIIQRVVNGDKISFENCGLSEAENKISASSVSESGYFFTQRMSGSLDQIASGSGTLVDIDEMKWTINGALLSSSMDVSVSSDSAFELCLQVIDGQTNETATNLTGDGSNMGISVQPRWIIESLVQPDQEESVAAYNSATSSLVYQPFTNGEATCSVDLSSDSNRIYSLRTGTVACNIIKD